MASHNFPACLAFTLRYEGGYSNHPRDPGGVTLEGVIQRVYDTYRDRKGLPRQPLTPQMRGTAEWQRERDEIYRTGYWDKVKGDKLATGIDLAVFDFGVNSGPARALEYLKASLGGSAADIVKRLCAKRLGFLRGLSTFDAFGRGWTARVAAVEAKGVRMALQASDKPPEAVQRRLETEAKSAANQSAKDASKAGGTAASPSVTQVPDTPAHVDLTGLDLTTKIGVTIAVIAILAVVGVFTYRWWVHRKRAQAYIEEVYNGIQWAGQ